MTWLREPKETGANAAKDLALAKQRKPENLFIAYAERGLTRYRAVRTVAVSLLYAGFGVLLFLATGFPSFPARSRLSLVAGMLALAVCVIAMILLVFFVLDATQLCKRFVRELARTTSDWPAQATKHLAEKRCAAKPEDLSDLLTIRVIAYRTHHVGKLMKYPFIVILVLIVSRHPIFDNWDWPIPLVILLTFNLLGAAFCGILLRRECVRARETVLRRLGDKLAAATAEATDTRAKQLEQIIADVKAERGGAFRPLVEDPVLQAVAIPFGGVGGLVLLEQLMLHV